MATRQPSIVQQVRNLFNTLDGLAFLPYWPEMLDFNLPENAQEERDELIAYRNSFKTNNGD